MIEDRLDRDIEVGAKARVRYSTDTVVMDGGWEFRNSRWAYPLFNFEFNLEPGEPDTSLDDFIDLFHAAGGSFESFKFRDWRDYIGQNENIGTGDGVTTAFQLYRVYQRGAVVRYRKITRPVTGTIIGYKNGVVAPQTVSLTTGIMTFSTAPLAGVTVTADFQFDLPVHFADDELEIVALNRGLDQPLSIVLAEERE